MVWASTAAGLSFASSVASFLTMLDLRCRWDVHASSVRWLFWFFFLCVCVRCATRSVFFVWMSMQPASERVDEEDPHSWTYAQLDRLGIHGVQFLPQDKSAWITIAICAGDLALVGIALALFPLSFELCRLARIAMDRGEEKERAQIQRYRAGIVVGIVAYALALLVLTVLFDGYSVYTHRCLLGVYGLQVVGLIYMVVQLALLKVNGRKYETIHGVFVASPVYQRLKQIMLVYAVFAFHFQIAMIVIYLHQVSPDSAVMNAVGISLIFNNSFGLALSITTSCSQACVFHTCAACIPEDLEAQFLQQRLAQFPTHESLEAPRMNPVFVYTDIQSSTALWNKDGDAMSEAIGIHDTIMRSALIKHRGYEITTVGDAFQVAFHTIGDAIEYCMDVQLQLLVADWPKELHGLVPATCRLSAGRRVVFKGLRVRMGIHDASNEDGRLIKDVHVVTGKATYSGVSEVVAEYVSELGSGGQILLTDRVATWLKHHRSDLSVDVFMEYLGEFTVPQVNTSVEIYHLQPAMLAVRTKYFEPLSARITTHSTEHHTGSIMSPERLTLPQRGDSTWTQGALARQGTAMTAELSEDDGSPTSKGPFIELCSPLPLPQRVQFHQEPREIDLAFAA